MITKLYSEIRTNIQTGDLVIWKVDRVKSLSTLILYLYQKICKQRASHVGIAVNINNRIFVVEAKPPYVRMFPLSRTHDFMLIQTNIKDQDCALDALLIHLGKPYSLFNLIQGIFGLRTSEQTLYCSELCALFYMDIGYLKLDPEQEILPGETPDVLIDMIEGIAQKEAFHVHIDRGNLKYI